MIPKTPDEVDPTPTGEAQIRTLPQWAQIYIRKLLLRVEVLRTQRDQAESLARMNDDELYSLRTQVADLETTVRTLTNLGFEP